MNNNVFNKFQSLLMRKSSRGQNIYFSSTFWSKNAHVSLVSMETKIMRNEEMYSSSDAG